MHFTVLRLLIIVALLVVLSRAYSNDVFEARDYIDGLSARTDASVSSLSTREIMAELSERLERRKSDTEMKYECAKCHATSNTAVWNVSHLGYGVYKLLTDVHWYHLAKVPGALPPERRRHPQLDEKAQVEKMGEANASWLKPYPISRWSSVEFPDSLDSGSLSIRFFRRSSEFPSYLDRRIITPSRVMFKYTIEAIRLFDAGRQGMLGQRKLVQK
ncbi:hypothetical protein DFP72DRAFT_857200 [Ephemerocybe angulata]|uniref:Uncharacterized protein n=1 Tax=Ephemerocybe angulata TaxID=980116 RepID=A0A8H6HF64_9AGAR|nr:hypothetical protein DFP72DRAFT_857200 [Tulosesus angulatus]